MGHEILNGLRGAAGLLTRVPVRVQVQHPDELAAAVPWFPVVGAAVGAVVAAFYLAASLILPSLVAATLAVAAGALLTGALHEDGLGDMFDAFIGGDTVEDRIRILKDPRLGTFGVVAISAGLLLRTGVIASFDTWAALSFLIAAHAISRCGAVAVMLGSPAPSAFNQTGLGASYISMMTGRQVAAGTAAGIVIGAVSIGVWVIPAAVLALLGALAIRKWSMRKIGGVTGDVLGAAQQTGEMLILLLGAAAFSRWETASIWRIR